MTELSSTNGNPQEVISVSDQSLSPESRASHVHSRNSSKTLKCPKCNWHYKYQETLEIHLKEKHQIFPNFDGILNNLDEGEINCSYCLTNNIHPRLARGEQYPCGFKPYRCDLCLYSTTTKGNLAIHMQSDKHINNYKDLSSPTILQPSISLSSPENSVDQSSQSQEMKVPCESLYTCPLCSQSDINTMELLKEHLYSNHNCTEDALIRCLSMIGDSGSSLVCMGDLHCCPDEYRCHCCQNKTFKDLNLLLNHFQDQNHIDEDEINVKSVGLLCWKKGCNQYFNSLSILEKHFNEIHHLNLNDNPEDLKINGETTKLNVLTKSRERLISIGEDIVLHYLENCENIDERNSIICDLCLKSFSSLTTLKVHYEDIHSIILSSRAIQHWLFLLQKLQDFSSEEDFSTKKLKRQSSSSLEFNQIKKSRYESNDNNKRQRTRITDEQLQILRMNFNINNSPSDEQIHLMSQKCFLTSKVIKHWFRNTLFKERQKNKDSPYNFSNPPSSIHQIDLDEYQKTGTIIHKFNQDSEYSDQDLSSNDEQELLLSDDDLNKLNKQQQQSRRANRTRFTDQQLRLLQEAFEANPYPKDDDLEILSLKLKLNSRVIVVWFQNARQKARKSYENNQTDIPTQQILKQEKDEGYSCKNCHKLFTRFAELMKHAKQCSSSPTNIQKTHQIKSEPIEKDSNTIDNLSSYQMLVAAASMAAVQQQQQPFSLPSTFNRKDNYCEQCDKSFSSTNLFNEHQTLHMQALINAAAFFPLAAYHPAAAACAAAMAALGSQIFNNTQTPNLTGVPPPSTPVSTTSQGMIRLNPSISSDSSNEMEEEEEEEGEGEGEGEGETSIDSNDESRKTCSNNSPKRNRTTILPEQQDYLMSKYSIESNPSRKMLEDISHEVKLKKRVVQVWFQNTRARERKGNIKIESSGTGILINKKCFHCSLTFKSLLTFENHLLTKHGEIYKSKEDLNLIDLDSFVNDDLPLDLSKSSIKFDKKSENEDLINEWNNDSTSQSTDNDNFKLNFNSKFNIKLNSNGHLSPTHSIQSSNEINGQRRFRTQMTPLQIKLMKAIFMEYRTPTMPECELLGKEIELQKRVVQVWFQNARAKEKKNPNFLKSDLPEEYQPTNEFCQLCQSKYTIENPQRDHLFTRKHIENIRLIFSKQISNVSIKKDERTEKNSMNMKFDLQTTVLDKSSKDDQNPIMSYLNLMHLMPIGMDPYNYGLMDPNIHGTPIFMLQLPKEALEKIVRLTKSDPHLTRVQYTQDGKNIQYFIDHGYTHIDYQTIDVGFACQRCNLVWPLYESCRCHALLCCQVSPSTLPVSLNSLDDLNNLSGYIFKIEQLTYRCLLCKTSYSTVVEYEKHTKDEIHLKKKRLNSSIEEND